MKKIAGVIYSIYAFAIFIIIMLLLFPFVIIASFFGRVKGGNMIYNLCRIWADIVLCLWGIRHRNIFEAPKAKEHAVIFVFNHISYIDIPFMMKAFRHEPIRILAKADMAKIPIFGYIYRNATVMVDRESDAGRTRSVHQLKRVLAKNISVVIAPEGTFNMTHKPLKEFYNGAFKIAIETNTPIQPVLFLDAYDRLNYNSIFSLTPGKSRAVFLPEILPVTDSQLLKQEVYNEMEKGLIRYKVSWIRS
ncbi:MAG: lysophospholipid acyltransferase family protein [Ferruginibacter sp.]